MQSTVDLRQLIILYRKFIFRYQIMERESGRLTPLAMKGESDFSGPDFTSGASSITVYTVARAGWFDHQRCFPPLLRSSHCVYSCLNGHQSVYSCRFSPRYTCPIVQEHSTCSRVNLPASSWSVELGRSRIQTHTERELVVRYFAAADMLQQLQQIRSIEVVSILRLLSFNDRRDLMLLSKIHRII